MKSPLVRRVRSWAKSFIEESLDVKIHRKPPFGTDSFQAVSDLRSWSPGDVIFDVGANDGRSVRQLLEYFPDAHIYAFEPVSATFKKLSSLTASINNVHSFQRALGAEPGTKTIYVHEKPSMSSLYSDWAEASESETVTITTLDHVITNQEIDFIHFLKIDTEGHEMAVLQGAEETLRSSKIGIVQVEAGVDSDISPHTSFEALRSFLAPLGYYPHGIFEQRRRRLSSPEKWSENKSKSYRPSAIKYFDVIFLSASLAGINQGA